MRKLLALLFVAAAFTFVACEGKKAETEDTTTVDTTEAPAPDPAPADTMAVDTTVAE